ncbi:hypothetical protein [Planktothrix paucivesiculata]|uniref:Uncharacterized protein n=1 Tax=Planktothrix paucivesiculata PCC 9631 TaxID=671071 RepID=A0A7Z9BGL3_9CYAN|nr:hypothetical protein [Planktothrix paucivesiculata]VXD12899.1 conserved hypothetical protein [Planktothrix paucivesiculata PCC 9631]
MPQTIDLHNFMNDIVLLLTATIDIKGMPKAYPSDPQIRQEDYFQTLKYYINHHPKIQKILFVENSGWSLEIVQKATSENPYNKEVEFISIDGNNFPRSYGKGYGEISLIDQGFKQSKLIQEADYIAKITGRIKLLNLTKILSHISDDYDCLCDIKDQGWIIKKYLFQETTASPYTDTRFLVFKKEFYLKYFKPLLDNHQDGCFYMEQKIYQGIQAAKLDQKLMERFFIEPNFSGISGHFQGKDYDSPIEKLKFNIRAFARQVAPWIHL